MELFSFLTQCAQIADADVTHCRIWTIGLRLVSDRRTRPKFHEKKERPPDRIKSVQEGLDHSWDALKIG
jgi:hypothetical protein